MPETGTPPLSGGACIWLLLFDRLVAQQRDHPTGLASMDICWPKHESVQGMRC
jgi:hypothetical protein